MGRINEPRNATDFGLHPEGTGDFEVLQAPEEEVTWPDLHFEKMSLSWEGDWIAGCRRTRWGWWSDPGSPWSRLENGCGGGQTGSCEAVWQLRAVRDVETLHAGHLLELLNTAQSPA